jgi:hypothetical protein|tara:strand:- start:298 stop:1230 length:933 start_codon:yes stop_codon:yes gene_type:complete
MDIVNIANKIACGGTDTANTGKLGCLSLFGTPTNALLLRKGTKIPATTTFNVAYLTPLIQQGTIVPLIGASSFEDVSSEDAYSTNASGVKRLNLKGLPEYKLMFEEGHEFYRQMNKLQSFKGWDLIIGDESGNWILSTNADGSFGGFTAGHITPELTKRKVQGGDSEMKSVLIQFTNRLQWDVNYAVLNADQLDFYAEDVPTVNGVDLDFTVAPSNSDTTLSVTALLNSDHDTKVIGLLAANFILKVNGATVVPSVTENPNGTYVLTISSISTGDLLSLGLWDSSLNVDVTDLTNILYRATPLLTATVVA